MICPQRTQVLFPSCRSPLNYENKQTKVKELTKMLKMMLLVPISFILLAPVVQTLDSAIYRINHYPMDRCQGNQLRYPLDRFLSGGQRYPAFEQPGPDFQHSPPNYSPSKPITPPITAISTQLAFSSSNTSFMIFGTQSTQSYPAHFNLDWYQTENPRNSKFNALMLFLLTICSFSASYP